MFVKHVALSEILLAESKREIIIRMKNGILSAASRQDRGLSRRVHLNL